MTAKCPSCGASLKVPETAIGREGKCPKCGHVFTLEQEAPQARTVTREADGRPPSVSSGAGAPPTDYGPALDICDESEGARRRRHMIGLGIVLLAGFLLPTMKPTSFGREMEVEWEFLNLESLSGDSTWQLAVIMVAPGAAGVALIAAALAARHPVRGVVILLLPLLPVLLLVFDGEARQSADFFFTELPPAVQKWALLALLAELALLVGTRVRLYRPQKRLAYVIGCIGGGVCLIHLVLPIFPEEDGRIPLMVIRRMWQVSDRRLVAYGLLVGLACLVFASIICILNRLSKPPWIARARARTAFWLIVAGPAAAAYLGVTFIFLGLHHEAPFILYLVGLVEVAKYACWIFGMCLLLPFGLIDLLVGRPAPVSAPAARRACQPRAA